MRTVEEILATHPRPLGPISVSMLGSFVAHLLVLVLWTGTPPSGMPGGGILRVNLAPGLSESLNADREETSTQAARAARSQDNERLVVEESVQAVQQVIQEAAQAVHRVIQEPERKEDNASLRLFEASTQAEPVTSNARDDTAKLSQDRGEIRARVRPDGRLSVKRKASERPIDQLPPAPALPKVQTAVAAKTAAKAAARERPAEKLALRASPVREDGHQTRAGPAAASRAAGERGGMGGDAYRRVQTALRRALLPRFDYPMLARRRGWEGRVRVSVLVEPDGDLKNIRVVESCGYRVLDEAALDDLREVGRLPEVNTWLEGREISVILPIHYRLK